MAVINRPRLSVEEQREELPKALLSVVDSNNEQEKRIKVLEGDDVDFSPLEAADVALAASVAALEARQIIAGAGMTGGGTLAADRTLNVIAHADGSIVVAADSVQVGVLASDAQHGVRGGGTQHAVAGAAAGFMSAADKTKLDAVGTAAPPGTRTITAGAGLTGGGDLTANRTLDVVAGDATIVVSANDIKVGAVLAANLPSTVVYGGGSGSVGRLAYWSSTTALTFSTRLALAGTAIASGDIALTGFGTLASKTAITGTDSRGGFTVISSGTGQTLNPAVTLTFKDGAFAAAPFAIVARSGGGAQPTLQITWTTTTTTLVIQLLGTPVSGEQFAFSYFVTG